MIARYNSGFVDLLLFFLIILSYPFSYYNTKIGQDGDLSLPLKTDKTGTLKGQFAKIIFGNLTVNRDNNGKSQTIIALDFKADVYF